VLRTEVTSYFHVNTNTLWVPRLPCLHVHVVEMLNYRSMLCVLHHLLQEGVGLVLVGDHSLIGFEAPFASSPRWSARCSSLTARRKCRPCRTPSHWPRDPCPWCPVPSLGLSVASCALSWATSLCSEHGLICH
jgi:hypothetical protein